MGALYRSLIGGCVAAATIALVHVPTAMSSSLTKGEQLLSKLVATAKHEGSLDTATITEVGPSVSKLVSAFNKRFGLNLTINVALGSQGGKFAKLFSTLDVGGKPEFDSLTGTGNDIIVGKQKGYLAHIKDWKVLLAAINPRVRSGAVNPYEVSPRVVGGYSFIWGTRTKALIYNTKLASIKSIPQSVVDLGNPKFKGKFTVAPWTDIFEEGLIVYKDKKKWLKTLDQIGRNAGAVLKYSPALNRILLGEFAFTYANSSNYWEMKRKDPTAPIGLHWFKDYTPLGNIMCVVPKDSRHPAAATLWALWMTTPEAHEIVQAASPQENLLFGQTQIDKRSEAMIKKSGSRLISYLDSPETVKLLKWYGTKEGRQYRSKIKNAITQRK